MNDGPPQLVFRSSSSSGNKARSRTPPETSNTLQDFLYRIEALEYNQEKLNSYNKDLPQLLESLHKQWERKGSAPALLDLDTPIVGVSTLPLLEERLAKLEKDFQWVALPDPVGVANDSLRASASAETVEERLTKLEKAIVQKSAIEVLAERLTKVEKAVSDGNQLTTTPDVLKFGFESLGARLVKLEKTISDEVDGPEGLAGRLAEVEKALSDSSNQLKMIPQFDNRSGTQDVEVCEEEQEKKDQLASPPRADADPSDFEPGPEAEPGDRVSSLSRRHSLTERHVQHVRDLDDFMARSAYTFDYILEGSAWDMMLLCTFHIFRPFQVFAIFAVFVANTLLQFLATCVIWFDFTEPAYDEPEVWRRWRHEDAHDNNFYSHYSDTSLVTRVCERDASLSVATVQLDVLLEFDEYHHGSIGSFVCMACIMIFFISMVHEVRRALRFAFASVQLHHTGFVTEIEFHSETNAIVLNSLSTTCVIRALCTTFLRIGVAVSLLLAGSLWLVQTPNVMDLILNVVAVEFVIELDDSLFLAFVPNSVKAVNRNLKPMTVSCPICSRLPCPIVGLTVVCLIIYSIVFWKTQVVPFSNTMREIEHELCIRGRKNFVVFEQSELLLPYIMPTKSDYDYSQQTGKGIGLAVKEILTKTDEDKKWDLKYSAFGEFYSDPTFVRHEAGMTVEEASAAYHNGCKDTPFTNWYSAFVNVMLETQIRPDVNNLIQSANASAAVCREFVSQCNEPKAMLLRLLCPRTCQCHYARGGLYFAGKTFGCPDCLEPLHSVSCEDPSPQELLALPGWLKYWQGFNIHAAQTWNFVPVNLSLVAEKGCAVLNERGVGGGGLASNRWRFMLCQGSYVGSVSSSLAPFCPQSCACGRSTSFEMSKWCPQSCVVNGSTPGCEKAYCDKHCSHLILCSTTPDDDQCKGAIFDQCMKKCWGCRW